MNVRNWLTLTSCKRTLVGCAKGLAGPLGTGLFLGVVAVSMWQQWSLTFGFDPLFTLIATMVISLSVWLGQRWQSKSTDVTSNRSTLTLFGCLMAWSMLHPFWVDGLTIAFGYIPLEYLENGSYKLALACGFSLGAWIVPGVLWSGLMTREIRLAESGGRPVRATCGLLIGVMCGLLLNSIIFSPALGVYVPAVAIAIPLCSLKWWFRRVALNSQAPSFQGVLELPAGPTAIRIAIAVLTGCLLACSLRFANQLMPHGAFVCFVQAAGVVFGMATGLAIAASRRLQAHWPSWSGLGIAAFATTLLALQPGLVNFSLWMNSLLTTVTYLIVARTALLMAIAAPFGMCLIWLAQSRSRTCSQMAAWSASFLLGLSVGGFLLGGLVDPFLLIATCSVCLLALSAALRVSSIGRNPSLRTAAGLCCLTAVILSLPAWRSCDDPSRTAKLLFSTPTFLAYRSGWELQHLPHLDDVRMIDRQEGITGPLTLWRGRVAELYVREAGVPRAIVSKSTEAVPQFAPEVLQAVYSLVIADQPGRVLLLGLSSGVPLSTSLSFPIREAVCFEGDTQLINLVRGPLARETGYDPLSDDRVTLHQVSPELALMTRPSEPFDVVISSPSSSAMTNGSVAFTREFYERAAKQLAERGLFCQRFECIDYGPEPLRLVVKAMQSAFRSVMAIETSAGEFLLLAANSSDVFIPEDVAARLETPHIGRILARCGLDWSTLLNQPAYDHSALGEICAETSSPANSALRGQLAAMAPIEVMRWANKQQEIQATLTATRATQAAFWSDGDQANWLEKEIQLTRRSRLVEWLGDKRVSRELLRRINEVVSQRKVVHENPDTHWWEYRKVLRKQLQDRPRSAIQQVAAMDEKQKPHPEDVRRRDYFVALGNAARNEQPTRQQIADVEEYLEPYDPLVSYFARHEVADLLGRSGQDPNQELIHRLHVIYFAPTLDASVWNVAKTLEALVNHPEAIPDDSTRFDALNGLIQTLRVRWEIRQSRTESSPQRTLEFLDQSLVAVEKAVTAMDAISGSAGVSTADWQVRREVINRLMVRPLMSYRTEMRSRQTRGKAKTKAMLDNIEEMGLVVEQDEKE